MVEYSSPNTNKLHLGHVRRNLLGYSVAEIIKASGKKYIKLKSSMIEIHICKSMLALAEIWKWRNASRQV
jgi:arginyl-tRNA synthetase